MKLTVTTFLSLDGVMQGPGGPTEDPRNGFDLGGWMPAHADNEFRTHMDRIFDQVDAFLLGRRTFEIFAGFWPRVTDPDNTAATRLNALPKHVVSSTLTDPAWANSTVIAGDLGGAVQALKDQPGRELQVHGSGRLARALHDLGLVDEWNLWTFPVVLGKGQRLFSEGASPTGFEVKAHHVIPTGATLTTLVPTGPAGTVDITIVDGEEAVT